MYKATQLSECVASARRAFRRGALVRAARAHIVERTSGIITLGLYVDKVNLQKSDDLVFAFILRIVQAADNNLVKLTLSVHSGPVLSSFGGNDDI